MKLKPIEDQVMVIVGANSGIGRLTALQAAELGAKVVAAGRSMDALQNLVGEINQKGGMAIPVEVEVTDFDSVKKVAERAVENFGRIDTWVHLAGVSAYAPFLEISPQEFHRIIEVNLLGQVYGAMAALPHIKREGRGALIHISSVVARRPLPYQAPYVAAKKGIVGFLDVLRMELEHENWPIAVTNIMPASIDTPLFDKALTRLGVKPRPIPPVYQPDLVVRTILYAAQHPMREAFVGGAGKGLGIMQRLSPRSAEKSMEAVGFAGQKSHEHKAASAPNNLYAHLEGYDVIHGSYQEEAKPASLYSWMVTHPKARVGLTLGALVAGAALSARVVSMAIARPRRTKSLPLNIDRSKLRLPNRSSRSGPQAALKAGRRRVNKLASRISNLRLPWRRRRGWAAWIERLPFVPSSWLDRIGV